MACILCGGAHLSRDHWEFLQTMPQEPVDMVEDLVKMGLYKAQQLKAGDKLNTYELRKALMLKAAGKGDPKRERLVLELAKQAGGLENAFS
ncbi:MAG: taurine ABC transporter substrate-binding protein, partial [Cyanobacteria bacterium J06627_32]